MADLNPCESCAKLKEQNPEFTQNGISASHCNSLKNDTGLKPSLGHDNCEDLGDIIDCMLGSVVQQLEGSNPCTWRKFATQLMANLHNIMEANLCSECGQWISIHELERQVALLWAEIALIWAQINALWAKVNDLQSQINAINTEITNIKNQITIINGKLVDMQDQIDDIENNIVDQDGYFAVQKVHRTTVAKTKFIDVSEAGNTIWFSGAPGQGESFISIPVTEMDLVDGIVAQPRVVGNKVHAVTVAVQSAVLSPDGNTYTVNFDTYLIEGIPGDEFPYNCPVDFIVFGRKKFNTGG